MVSSTTGFEDARYLEVEHSLDVRNAVRCITPRAPNVMSIRATSPLSIATLELASFSTMQTVLALVLLVSINLIKAENCTVLQVYNALQPLASDSNFATCQTDSNYTLLSFASPSLNKTTGFCTSSACQALLNTTLSSGLLPDCEVVLGLHALNLSDAVSIATKCGLRERAVSESEGDDTLGRTTDNVVTIVGHSVPMDELSDIMALLRE